MVDTFPRAKVTPERYRELEVLAWQVMLLLPHQNLDEVCIVKDLCDNILRRWIENERLAGHEIAVRQGTPLLVQDGNIIHLPLADRP